MLSSSQPGSPGGRPPLLLFLLLAAGAAAAEPEAAAPTSTPAGPLEALAPVELRRDTTGFYPLWEGTGHVERSGAVRLGSTGAQVGILGVAHVGVQPVNYLIRAPNGYAKVALFASERWHLAAQVGLYRLFEGASTAFFSPMYSSRLSNPDFAVTLVPVSLSASVEVAPWLEINQTLTGLTVIAPGHLDARVTPGLSVVAELNPRGRHGVSLHATEVGFWAHDLAITGASYRYRNTWMELRMGYFYRFSKSGSQSAPIVSFGVLL